MKIGIKVVTFSKGEIRPEKSTVSCSISLALTVVKTDRFYSGRDILK